MIQVDNAFLERDVTDSAFTVLIAFGVERGMGTATTVSQKGNQSYPEKCLEEFLCGTGYDKIVVHVDPELGQDSCVERHRNIARYTCLRNKERRISSK